MDKAPHLTLVPGDDEDNFAGFRAKVREPANHIPPEKYRGILEEWKSEIEAERE